MQRFRKDVIARMAMPYPLGTVQAAGETCVVAAPEAEGPLVLSRPPYTGAAEIAPGPGGCMALVSAGMAGSDLFAIMGCFVGYKFQTGGILRFTPEDHGPPTAPWHSQRIAELPFAHRMELVWRGGERWLVA
ncbi:MAG TPA: hypothetical protein VL359_00720, partial [bacterium]|nr:hypothetical protein [bacterium]